MHIFAVVAILALSSGAWGLPTSAMGGMIMGMMGSQKPRVTTQSAAPPQPCCLLPTWEGMVLDFGNNKNYDMVNNVVYDSTKSLQGISVFLRSSNKALSQTLIDYGKKMMYTAVYPEDCSTPTCYRAPYTAPMVKCLNDSVVTDLKYNGSATAGRADVADGGVYFNFWRFRAGENAIDLALAPVKDTDICYPVFEHVKSSTLDNQYWFLNLSERIFSTQLLEMPQPCVQ